MWLGLIFPLPLLSNWSTTSPTYIACLTISSPVQHLMCAVVHECDSPVVARIHAWWTVHYCVCCIHTAVLAYKLLRWLQLHGGFSEHGLCSTSLIWCNNAVWPWPLTSVPFWTNQYFFIINVTWTDSCQGWRQRAAAGAPVGSENNTCVLCSHRSARWL